MGYLGNNPNSLAYTVTPNKFTRRFSGNGVLTHFDIGVSPKDHDSVDVYFNGVYQQKNTYIISDTEVVFDSAPLSGTDNIEINVSDYIKNPVGIQIGVTNNSVAKEEKIASEGQTVFSLDTFTYFVGGGNLQVYVNGLLQDDITSYIETSESVVTFLDGLNLGDKVTFVVNKGTNNVVDIQLRSDLNSSDGASLIGYLPAGAGAVATDVQSKLRESVSVKDFGAVGDGVADDTAAVVAAWEYARTTSKKLYIPGGTYLLTNISTSLEPSSNMTVYGDGMNASILKFNKTTAFNLIYRAPNLSRLNSIEFRDFAIDGSHGDSGDYTQVSSYPFLLYNIDELSIRRVKVEKSRVMGIALRRCTSVDVSGCAVQYCARDGISTTASTAVSVTNNRVEFCDDDAITFHSDKLSTVGDRQFTCVGNTIRFSQGIKCLGARSALISGNTIEFFMSNGICVETQSISTKDEGVSASSGVVITSNTLKNGIDRTSVDGLSAGAPYIEIGGVSAQAGTVAAIPGENDTATGTFVGLYPYFGNISNNNTTGPVPPSYNIIISDNTLVRDIEESGLLSSLGFGVFYTRTGPKDVTLSTSAVLEDGVVVVNGIVKNMHVRGNTFMGIRNGVFVASQSRIINGLITGNTFYDMTSAVAFDGTNTEKHGIAIDGNVIDIDPMFRSTNRGLLGTWLADGAPSAIVMQGARGITVRNNIFKNTCRLIDQSPHSSANIRGNFFLLEGNVVEGIPFVVGGFNVANVGVGHAPRGGLGFVYRVVDCNPSSATYGQVLNHNPTVMPSMPTDGYYPAGHYVRNSNAFVTGAAASKYIVQGWFRLTTGNAHVLNTDWVECRTLTGT